MRELDIEANRAASKYTKRELCMRLLWGVGKCLFRLTPRPCFGLRRWILRCFGAKIGYGVNVYPSATIYFPWNLEVGDDAAIGEWALVYNLGPVRIGARTTISQRVHICAGSHDYKDPAMPLLKPRVEVGDEVWVCADAFIGPGVFVANRAIVGARSVVVKDVEAGSIVGGNPTRIIGTRQSVNGL